MLPLFRMDYVKLGWGGLNISDSRCELAKIVQHKMDLGGRGGGDMPDTSQ